MRILDNGSRPEGAIIDLDGTLYPREQYLDALLGLIEKMFRELKGLQPSTASARVKPLRDAMQADWGSTSATAFVLGNGFSERNWERYRDDYLHAENAIQVSPQIQSALRHLHSVMKISVLTNNSPQSAERILRAIGVSMVDDVDFLAAAEAGIPVKPQPDAFIRAITRLGLPAESCWGVGDRYEIDIEPLASLGGGGIVVAGPQEFAAAKDTLLDLSIERKGIVENQ